ncbi:hypothetical protein PPYR_13986 [Photinus pyralis]|uniref:UDP-glucuronosyltransferase n=2 Tax=Photinus pyralis TaxID=7054 RepID=A0A5N4A3W7_PHOPY|nr:UDP-glucuronosyltransferase 2B15-like [Photinus pyralis]KAB0792025.1 hypothetical protein PPYR_13986 [Photinus pyralis]
MLLKLCLFGFAFCSVSQCARILVIVPTPSHSHHVATQPIWKELCLRGHQVTSLTTVPINDPKLTNLTEIDISFSNSAWHKDLKEIVASNHFLTYINTYVALANSCDVQLAHPSIQALIKSKNESFDLVITESTRPAYFAFAQKFNCPSIGINTLDASPSIYSALGNPTHPLLYPDYWISYVNDLSLFQRIFSVVHYAFIMVCEKMLLMPMYQEITNRHFGSEYPPLEQLIANMSLLLVNSESVFRTIRPRTPNIIPIGGNLIRLPAKPLPKDLKEALDNAKNGFIYFSLGSNVKSNFLDDRVRDDIMGAFRELPYLVVWKLDTDSLPNNPKNVLLYPWVPQLAVLNHPNLKLFITHGGLQSMTESIYANVPMLGIPFFADQDRNVQEMVAKGYGVYLDHRQIEKRRLVQTILEVITNPKYRSKLKELAELSIDQPMTGLERAVWWIEYVLRHKGAKHLQSPAISLPFYQHYFLDVIAVLVLIVFGTMYTLCRLRRAVFSKRVKLG